MTGGPGGPAGINRGCAIPGHAVILKASDQSGPVRKPGTSFDQRHTVSLSTQPNNPNEAPHRDAGNWPLLGPDDPPPFEVVNPSGSAPFLLVCDHASRQIPPRLNKLGLADWVLERHVACDIGAKALTLALSKRFDAVAVLAGYSRLVVDLNRQLHDPSAFIKVSDGIAIPGNIELDEAERQARIETFFDPYHAAVSDALDGLAARGPCPGSGIDSHLHPGI